MRWISRVLNISTWLILRPSSTEGLKLLVSLSFHNPPLVLSYHSDSPVHLQVSLVSTLAHTNKKVNTNPESLQSCISQAFTFLDFSPCGLWWYSFNLTYIYKKKWHQRFAYYPSDCVFLHLNLSFWFCIVLKRLDTVEFTG